MQAVREYQLARLEEKRQFMEQKDRILSEKQAKIERQKKAAMLLFSRLQANKIRRNKELRAQLDQVHEEQIKRMTIPVGQQRHVSRSAINSKSADSDMSCQQMEEKEMSYEKRQLLLQLRREEARRNQMHKQRQIEARNEMARQKAQEEDERSKKLREEQLQMIRHRRDKIAKLRIERERIAQDMKDFAVTNKVDMRSMQQLAEKWGIDMEAMMARYEKSSTLPPLEQDE
jgi:hypothetical protein